ncbi:MAG TPA: hypothetical protein VKT72_14750 [Candidatus Baltobacteraceae bacterium]|nr:hypothetical protein [Candidatus Baltobacteraceae bacterium]
MKTAFFAAVAALTLTAVPAVAQVAPPPPGMPNAAMRQRFDQMRQRMEHVHQTARAAMLNALTPAHKALLAQIAGQLATATAPDFDAAAARLNAALSSGEKQAIMNAAQTVHTQMQSEMESMRSAMPSPPPGAGGHMMMMRVHRNEPHDAGHILLFMTLSAPQLTMMMR